MRIGSVTNSEILVFLLSVIFLSSLPGILSSRDVTLDSIQIFATHEWLNAKPTVYFHCQGGNKTILPDVKKKHFLYTFKGEESWQPLTELPDSKCKRCGLYEKDSLKSDDVFDEWELCPSDLWSRMENISGPRIRNSMLHLCVLSVYLPNPVLSKVRDQKMEILIRGRAWS
ncbi:uncharacterized protein LOC143885137 [Tasmannia lanceolata]|uniref:uncharacterized protein LOC143885137 n=1 Tax=Tasmannia lanceolata TaxID=3420 RepID=UPI0040642F04